MSSDLDTQLHLASPQLKPRDGDLFNIDAALTEEERALLALGELGSNDDDEESLAEELGIDLADLQMEGGDEEAVPEQ